jgi:cytochrome c oxidase subunit 3
METLAQQRRKASKPLLWIGIGSIIMAFAGLTSGYVVSRTTLVANNGSPLRCQVHLCTVQL